MHTCSFVSFATSLFWPAAGPSFREMFRALFHHLGGCSYGVQQFSRLSGRFCRSAITRYCARSRTRFFLSGLPTRHLTSN